MHARHEILLIGPDTTALVSISELLDDARYAVSFAQSPHPIDHLLVHRQWQPAGAIVRLAGDEDADAFPPLFQAYRDTSFLFLTALSAPDVSIDAVVARNGGAIVDPAAKSPQRLVEDLSALMFHHRL